VGVVRLDKVKRPAGVFSYSLQTLGEDPHGSWLYGGRGSPWSAPHDWGMLPFDVALLVPRDGWWVAWWVAYPEDRQVEIDICLPASRTEAGWSYVDLELDVYRHDDGSIEVKDADEFEEACRNGWISPGDATAARATAASVAAALREARAPLDDTGWERLTAARSNSVMSPSRTGRPRVVAECCVAGMGSS
jgi:hypothetical protein